MNQISIQEFQPDSGKPIWRAFALGKESFGQTAGEAVDALSTQLNETASDTFIVRRLQPDRHFPAEQQQRLAALMAKWRDARDQGSLLSQPEHAELQKLIDEELAGATQRALEIEKALRS